MTVPTTIDPGAWLSKHLTGEDGDGDLARALLAAFAETLMSAHASMMCEAGYNGVHRHRLHELRAARMRIALRPAMCSNAHTGGGLGDGGGDDCP